MKYHDEGSIYSARRSRLTARRLVYTALIALALLLTYTSFALAEKLSPGDVVQMSSSFCVTESDGRALLEVVQGGTAAGIEYMAKEDNTCVLGQLIVVIGEIVHTKGAWVLVKVMSPHGEVFSVSQKKYFRVAEA